MDAQEREAWLKDRMKWRREEKSRMKAMAFIMLLMTIMLFGLLIASWFNETFTLDILFVVLMAFLWLSVGAHATAHKAPREELTMVYRLLEAEDPGTQGTD